MNKFFIIKISRQLQSIYNMKWFFIVTILMAFFISGCESRKREEELQKKEAALNQKEQELLLKETTLQLKEAEILKREQLLDTVKKDSTHLVNPALVGMWSVKMTCTETSCTGSAVGDTRTEEWQLSYQGNNIIAQAMTGDNLVRVYTGFFTGNTIELVEERENSATQPTTKMIVRLTMVNEKTLEGQREIVRDNNCKIIYSMQMDKK